MALDFCKWDLQVGDTATLFRQPLLISEQTWTELKLMTEHLTAELGRSEAELLERPDIHSALGLPPSLQRFFRKENLQLPPAARILRFDFHYTTEGWRISEVNSDVPGGYAESSRFSEMVCQCCPGTRLTGNPIDRFVEAIVRIISERGKVGLLSAPGYMEDQQVTCFLGRELEARRIVTFLLHHPSQLNWHNGLAHFQGNNGTVSLDAIVRFYQAEWLSVLPDSSGWRSLFINCKTHVVNPGFAVITESKRFPLVWSELSSCMDTWKKLMPPSYEPREVNWGTEDGWVMKAAFSNTGNDVHMRSSTTALWKSVQRMVKRHSDRWVAQRHFETVSVDSDIGPVFPCLGVYAVNGEAAGVYARISKRPIIDYSAVDVALLIKQDPNAGQG